MCCHPRDRREQRRGMVWSRVRTAAGSGGQFARLGTSNRMGLGRYEGFRPQKIVSNVTHDAGAMCYIRSTKKMRRCDPTAQPSAVRDHQPGEPTPRTSGSSRPCPWYRANRDSLPTAPKQDFTPPLVTVKHMIIPARGAGFGPEPPQGPRGVAPCPGFSAAHCRGA